MPRTAFVYTALCTALVISGCRTAPCPEPVAVIGDETICESSLPPEVLRRVFPLKSKEYSVKRQAVQQYIEEQLLDREAAARGLSRDELLRIEVESKVDGVDEEEVRRIYERAKEDFSRTPEAEALARIRRGLRQQRVQVRRREFVETLATRTGVRILLEPPRVYLSPGNDPVDGPQEAPVTIIVFSDYECPFCARLDSTVRGLKARYGADVRVVAKDFPLPNHPHAAKAAEAAECAHEQGKFWEMHHQLLQNRERLEEGHLRDYASAAGLDLDAFTSCLSSGRNADEWREDKSEGETLGISGTPSLLVNGRLLAGAVTYHELVSVIEEELELAGRGRTSHR